MASKVASLSDAVGGYIQRSDVKAVLYDEAQTLTEEQKAQARTNIGAIAADEAQVPVASETRFGTIKCWIDGEGYDDHKTRQNLHGAGEQGFVDGRTQKRSCHGVL